MQDYYRILGVPQDADADEIRRAYRRLVRQYHPDLTGNPDAAAFKRVREAYEMLSDHERRAPDAVPVNRRRDSVPVAMDRWFDDEVAIDFPSIDSIVERIRESFFGPSLFAAPVSVEILLTPYEAFTGVNVPLDVPVRQTCARCGGRGEVWMDSCTPCRGSGEASARHRVQLLVPAGVPDGHRFRFSITPRFAPATLVEVRIAIA